MCWSSLECLVCGLCRHVNPSLICFPSNGSEILSFCETFQQAVAASFQWEWMLCRIGRRLGRGGWRGEWGGRWGGGQFRRGANECHCIAVRGGAKNTYWHMGSNSQTGTQTNTHEAATKEVSFMHHRAEKHTKAQKHMHIFMTTRTRINVIFWIT